MSVKGGHRARNALLDAPVGGGAGAGTFAAADDGRFFGRGTVALAGGVLFAVVGAVVGALIPGSTTIYRADAGK